MIGVIDDFGRALLSVSLRSAPDESAELLEVWVDTGFTGELVLPHRVIELLRLPKSGSVDAILADGSAVELSTFTCFIDWFDAKRRVEVVENDGDRALLGVGLLLGCELRANYRTLSLTLTPG
jgi:clan AA aspartic protease